ncbi:MAG: hypothetical protein ACFFB2_14455 [Promethearchaeota archaeon]
MTQKNVISQGNNPNYLREVSKSNIEKNLLSAIQIEPRIIKSQKIGSLTLRGGLIGTIISSSLMSLAIISMPFDAGFRTPFRYYLVNFGLYTGILGLILFTFIFYLGVLITFFNEIKAKRINSVTIKNFVINRKFLVIISIIAANWALSLIPQVFLLPFYSQVGLYGGASSFAFPLEIGKDFEQFILIEIVQGILEHPDLETGIFGRLIRLIAIGILICTVYSLIWSLIEIFKDFRHLSEKTPYGKIVLDLCFKALILVLLIFEIISPIWEFADPSGFQRLWWSDFLIDLFIATPLSIFILLFLITGSFTNDSFVMEDKTKFKSRLVFSISLTFFIVGYSWFLVYVY